MKRHLRNAIARIDVLRDGESISRGTGFLVTERLVLTALHVVANRRNDPPEPYPGAVMLKFPGHETQAHIYEQFFDRGSDWVLLKCVDPPRCRPMPLARLEADGLPWETYGFPDANPRDGMVQMGSLENHDASLDGAHAFQLFSRQAAAGSGAPVKGLSGAPVIVDGAVVGLLRFALMKEGQTVAGTVYACSMAALVDRAGDFLTVHHIDDWRVEQKRRRRQRMAWTAGLAAAVLFLIAGAFLMFRPSTPSEFDPRYIAILPFSASGDQTDPALAAGMDEALRDVFYNSQEIETVSRAYTAPYLDEDIPDMARELEAGSVLGGEIEQRGDDLTADVWLKNAAGEVIWQQRIDGKMSELFELHTEIASSVATELGVDLGEIVPRGHGSGAAEARAFYLGGVENVDAALESGADIFKYLQPPETDEAIRQLEQALALYRDARTLAYLSQACSLRSLSAGGEFADKARETYRESLDLDDELAQAHFAKGLYLYWTANDFVEAERSFSTALEEEPDNQRFAYFQGAARRRLGQWDEALASFESAASLDETAWKPPYEVGRTRLYLHDYEAAVKSFDDAIQRDPNASLPYVAKAAAVMSWKGDLELAMDSLRDFLNADQPNSSLVEALMVTDNRPILLLLDDGLRRTLDRVPSDDIRHSDTSRYYLVKSVLARDNDAKTTALENAERLLTTGSGDVQSIHHNEMLALVYAGLGRSDDAVEAADEAAREHPISRDHHRGAVTSSLLTEVYITLGKNDLALQHLEQLLKNPSHMSVEWIRADPLFDPLRDNPQLQQLLDDGESSAPSP